MSIDNGKSQLDAAPGRTFRRSNGGCGETLRGCRPLATALVSATLMLSGCAVGPNYVRPKVSVPADFRGEEGAAQQASYADLPWWEVFKDDQLQALISTALANNYDLAIAVSRVEQSRQLANVARAQYFPMVGYSVGASDGKNEFLGSVAPSVGYDKGSFLA